MIRNILVPLDGSKFGEQALPRALQIARQANAQLHLVHVVVPLIVGDPMMQYASMDVEDLNNTREYMANLLKQTGATGLKSAPTACILEGPVIDALANYIEAHQIDLAVLAAHGRAPLARAVVGSVSDELIRKVTVPTLVITVRDPDTPRTADPFRHVLIAVDGTVDSEAIMTPAMELARLSGAAITIIRVVESNKPITKSTQPPPVTEIHLGAEHGHTAESELHRLTNTLRGQKLAADARIIDSDRPDEAIIDEAKRLNCDLIALETHGRSGLARLFRGSVSDKVLRAAPGAVLVHRSDHRIHKGESSMPSDELVSVYQANDAFSARIIAAELASEGIACRVSGENQGAFPGLDSMSVEVLVHADDFDRARKLIREGEPGRRKPDEEE